MIQVRLWQELEKVASRYRRVRICVALAIVWLVAALIGWALHRSGVLRQDDLRMMFAVPCAIAAGLALVGLWIARATAPRYDWVARQIEAAYPDLRSSLLTAMEQTPALPFGKFGFLQEGVIQEAVEHAGSHPWREVVPSRRITAAMLAQFASLGVFLATLAAAAFWVGPAASDAVAGIGGAGSPVESFTVTVEPGHTEIEKGSSLLVMARIAGPVPAEATLKMRTAAGDETQLPMSRSLEDPVFGGRIPVVNEPLDYQVETGGQTTASFRVTVFEYPRLERADVKLVYPGYTGMEPRLVQDVRTISVVEGTQLTLTCYLNKNVASATLTEAKHPPLVLTPAESHEAHPAYAVTIVCEQTRRLKLELVDEAGRKNVQQSDFVIQVVPNLPPTLKPVFPSRDLEVSALEEMDIKATAWDDFGVKRMGLTYAIAGQPPVDVVLGEDAAAKQRHEMAHQLRLEDLKAEPDQLLSYYFWAEDFASDGNLRRTSSDMYFAEVRHFEEIFRQGQQPPGGAQQQQQQEQGNQNSRDAQQLAQLQKDIINATWKVIRREIGTKLTSSFSSDVEEIAKSQAAALEQAEALAERVQDPESQEHIAAVAEAMQQAIQHLNAAKDQASVAPLSAALGSEQAAYQGLLKLRAREHEVTRQQRQQQQGQQSRSARSQQQRQQLQQLELKNDENRYETQRLAQSPQETQEDRENRQVLNRLKELARRQHDLNERLKDLQSALQEADTPEKQEEIKRQLKRLQEEQQQMLRDTDELRSRMETPENQERMSDERQQLEQTREQVRRASESLEKQEISQAAASGSRAEREFEELRNEFRRRASNRFSEEMREMRDAARELDRREQQLGEQLAQPTQQQNQKAKSLRSEDNREQIMQGLAEQRQRLSGLLDRMKQTIQEAEQTEPLLSEKLYEAAREAQNQNTDRALDAASRSLRQGLMDDAREIEKIAGRGISQLREGIEKATETVLGDETEALRRAREELQNLADQLNREIAANSPENAPQQETGRPGQPQPGAQELQPGEQSEPDARRGQQRPGGPAGRQPGEPQENGERRPGQAPSGEQQPADRPEGQEERGQQPGQRQNGQQRGQPPGQQQRGQPGERGQGQRQPGQPGEQQPGEQPSGEQQPGEGQQPGQGQRPGERPQQGQRQQPGQGQQPGEGQQPGQPQDGQRQPGGRQPGQQRTAGGPRRLDGTEQRGGAPFDDQGGRFVAPITGEGFREWADRLRDVEEMVDDPEIRAEAARIRERARAVRAEFKRHSQEPNWGLVQSQVAGPLVELSNRVADELLRRNSKQAVVPLDRDPVPPKYSEKTRRYYEQLGSGR
jgi:hypothetical protein